MNPGRLRRYAVRLVAVASLAMGLLLAAGGAVQAGSSWADTSSSGSSAPFTPSDSSWQ